MALQAAADPLLRASGIWVSALLVFIEVRILIHSCSSCRLAEVWFEVDDPDVYLNLNRVATEEDLEHDHYLEYAGETIETIQVQVVFCPYCGQRLASSDGVIVPQFRHHNFGSPK